MEPSTAESTTPLLRDSSYQNDDDAQQLGDLAVIDLPESPAAGDTAMRNVNDPVLASSEDVPLLMDAIAVDPTPEQALPGSGEIPEVKSVIALPERLGEAAATMLSVHSNPRKPIANNESRSGPPSLSLVAKEAAPTAEEDHNTGTEVLDDAALLALLNAPTTPPTAPRTELSEEIPPDIALGGGAPNPDPVADEPMDFQNSSPPLDFEEPPTTSTSALIEKLKSMDMDNMPELSLPSLPMEQAIPVAQDPTMHSAPKSKFTTPSSPAAPNSGEPADGPIHAAANTLAGELQLQLYRKIDQLIAETVDTLTRDLHTQLGAKVESMVLDAIDETLPPLMEQFAQGLRSGLKPKLHAKLPLLLAEIMGKRSL